MESELPTGRIVYIVDDDPVVRDSLAFLLDTMGIACRTFDGGSSFLAALPDLPCGCVLLDVMMPEVNGLDVMRRLIELDASMPVVLMTAANSLAVMRAAAATGPHLLIKKPFDDTVLIDAIRSSFDAIEQRAPLDTICHAQNAVARLNEEQRLLLRAALADMSVPALATYLQIDELSVRRLRIATKAALGARDIHHALEIATLAGLAPLADRSLTQVSDEWRHGE